MAVRCLSESNSGASTDGFVVSQTACTLEGCVAYNNGRDGIRVTATPSATLQVQNCIAETNAGTGINVVNVNFVQLTNNAVYNNTTANVTVGTGRGVVNSGLITGTGSFFVDAPNANFALNNTASAGASARAAGFPGVGAYGGTGYIDVGMLQHQDAGGSSGAMQRPVSMRGGLV